MFENLPVQKTVSKKAFEQLAQQLRTQLLLAQRAAAQRKTPIVIIVAGLDGAGKGSAVHRLNEWMDARWIDTHAFMETSDEEESRPYYWRFWRRLPDRGTIGIFFGSWYTEPRTAALRGDIDRSALALRANQIEQFERMLSDDGALIIKLWFHISRDTQYRQLTHTAPHRQQNLAVQASPKQARDHYRETLKIGQALIAATHSSHSPWHIIQAEDKNARDIAAGECVLDALEQHAHQAQTDKAQPSVQLVSRCEHAPNLLSNIDLAQTMAKKDYRRQLKKYQGSLQALAWELYERKRSIVAVFEGWDAAGKGSSIRRITNAIDPRLFKVLRFAAPTDEERRQHYLWRFWRKLQRDGRSTLFDRSWYGRVLVERVEQFATAQQWQRSYEEINQFERQLSDHGTQLVKFWLHISPEEQLRRFQSRQQQPHKQFKITDEDWRNRDQRQAYERAVEDMVRLTSTETAPWTLIAADNKRYARIEVLKTFCKAMEDSLNKG